MTTPHSVDDFASVPTYLHELAEMYCRRSNAFAVQHELWRNKFTAVHFERFSEKVPAAAAEVTLRRPPFDYAGQQPRRKKSTRMDKSTDDGGEPDPAWTFEREVLIAYPSDPGYAPLNDQLLELADLYLRATNYADPEDAVFCHRLLRLAISDCVSLYDGWSVSTPTSATIRHDGKGHARLASINHRCERIRAIYQRCASRRTVTQYTLGMLIGVAAAPVIVMLNLLSFLVIERISDGFMLSPVVQVSVHLGTLLGAVGAMSSVLLRISSSSVNLDYESTRHGWKLWNNPVMQRGLARVVIGTIFGGIAAWFVHAGMLVPDTAAEALDSTESAVLLTGVVGFISGFSERFIPDLILRSSSQS